MNILFPSVGGTGGGVFTWINSLSPAWTFFAVLGGIALGLFISNQFMARRIQKNYQSSSIYQPKPTTTVTDYDQRYAAWMTAAFNRDMDDLQNCLYIYHHGIDFKHLIDINPYFEVTYQIRSASVFTLNIGKNIDGHIFYEDSEFDREPEVRKSIGQLERNGHDKIVLRQWVSLPMVGKITEDAQADAMVTDEERELTFYFKEVNIVVSSKYPDASEGPHCRLDIPSKISKKIPTWAELKR